MTGTAAPSGSMRFLVGFLAVLALGAIVLAAPARVVFAGERVRLLADTDPHYHVLRAERMLRGAPGAPWYDPALDWPRGAEVIWPPAFDAAIVALARATGATSRDDVARAASVLPVLLGLASIAIVALLGRRLYGGAAGTSAAVILALLPAHAAFAVIGRVDHHVAEVLFASLIALALLRGIESDGADVRAQATLAGAVALSFWTWMGSAIALVAPAALVALARLAGLDDTSRRAGRMLALGCGLAAILLAGSIALLGPPGALARGSLYEIGGLHVAIVAGASAFAALIAWCSRRPEARWHVRALEVAAAFVLPAGLLLGVFPDLWNGVVRGFVALGAANPWYEDIREFRPMFLSGVLPLGTELAIAGRALGLVPAVAALAIPAGLERWREDPRARGGLSFLAVWGGTTFLLALVRNRFLVYTSIPLAIAAAIGVHWAARRVAHRFRRPALAPALAAVLIAAALAPALPGLRSIAKGVHVSDQWIEAASALRTVAAPPDERTGVAAPWVLGHLVQYYADRPVLTCPFGTEAGADGLQDWSRFLFTSDEREAERILLARRISHLVLRNPSHEVVGLRGFDAQGALPALAVTRTVWSGETVAETPRFGELVASRLYFADGMGASAPVDAFRLVWEGETTHPALPVNEERLKIFELVAGAQIRVIAAAAGTIATATVELTTNTGRVFHWSTSGFTDRRGEARLRVPYATGANGAVRASVYVVGAGSARSVVIVSDADVEHGRAVAVTMQRQMQPRRPRAPPAAEQAGRDLGSPRRTSRPPTRSG